LFVAASRGHRREWSGWSDRFEALLFEHAQHFGLRAETHIADFIEEESAAIGLLKLATLSSLRR